MWKEIDENSRLGAVLFYDYWRKNPDGQNEMFAGIEYNTYDYAVMVNERTGNVHKEHTS